MKRNATLNYTSYLFLAAVVALAALPAQAQFAAATGYSTGADSSPNGVALGDINGDGNLDIVTANSHSDTAGILLGRADGSFSAATTYPTGARYTQPYSVALGDFNADGHLDIVVSNFGTRMVSVLLAQTGGGFSAPTLYQAGGSISPYVVAVGDVNGDRRLDIIAAAGDGNAAGVLLGNGNGTFAAVTTYSTGIGRLTEGVALGDMNADGRLDIVTADGLSNTASVLLAQAGGGFATASNYATGPGSSRVALGDINGDGRLDIVTSNFNNSTVGVLLSQPAGGFAPVSSYFIGTKTLPYDVKLSDVNADGRLDIITANSYTIGAGVLLAQAGGGFEPSTLYSTGYGLTYSMSVALGDFNKDGLPDMVVTNAAANTVGVLLNTTVRAAPIPVHILTAPPVLCRLDTVLQLAASPAGGIWRGAGITDSRLGIFSAATVGSGRHVVRYELGSGASRAADSITIAISPVPTPVVSPSSQVVLRCGQASELLSIAAVSTTAGTRYDWQYTAGPGVVWHSLPTGNGQPTCQVAQAGLYRVRVTQGSCAATSSPVEVHIESQQAVVIPTIFTPNHDRVNDQFELRLQYPRTSSLRIFNRWGQQVFTSDTYGDFWTGSGASEGVYYYLWRYSTDCEPTERIVKGWVQLAP